MPHQQNVPVKWAPRPIQSLPPDGRSAGGAGGRGDFENGAGITGGRAAGGKFDIDEKLRILPRLVGRRGKDP
jgi:hypothetical protein